MSDSFSQLETLVREGKLSVTFVLGLARGGTTAFEKHLFSSLPYDANVNEPSLLGPPPDADGQPVDRIEATFAQVLTAVLKAQQARQGLVRLIVKEVTNKVLPSLMPLWRQLSHVVLVIVRHPPLQFESRIKSILDRIESDALVPFGVDQHSPACTLEVHGHQLCSGTHLSPQASWKEVFGRMKQARDFSGIGSGLARVAALHPFCNWPECQRAMWGSRAAEWEGAQMSEFERLPNELCEATLRWRLGWAPLQEQMLYLDEHKSVAIVDFSCFQMDPASHVLKIGNMLRTYWGSAIDESRSSEADSFEVCSTSGCWDPGSWDRWYFKPCFTKAANSSAIEPMLKPPMRAAQLPQSLQPALHHAYDVYLELVPPLPYRCKCDM